MTKFVRSSLLSLAVSVAPCQIAAQSSERTDPQVTIQGDSVQITTDGSDGIPVLDFVKLANTVTGRAIVIDEHEFGGGSAVEVVGTISMKKSAFFGFFQSMMYAKGFGCLIHEVDGSEVVEVISMTGSRRSDLPANARYTPFEDVESMADQAGIVILTVMPLSHVKANAAVTTLRPFFMTAGQVAPLQFGTVGNERSLFIQGFAPQVAAACRLLKLADRPGVTPEVNMQVLRLEHADVASLSATLQRFLMSSPPGASPPEGLAIVPDTDLNVILVRGSSLWLEQVSKLVGSLDVASKDRAVDEPTLAVAKIAAPVAVTPKMTVDGDRVSIRIDDRGNPVTLFELVAFAQRITGDIYMFGGNVQHKHREQGIYFAGDVELSKSTFPPFFAGVLESLGYSSQFRGEGGSRFVQISRK